MLARNCYFRLVLGVTDSQDLLRELYWYDPSFDRDFDLGQLLKAPLEGIVDDETRRTT